MHLRTTDAAYWAGYLDGEGCFRLVNGSSPRIEVTTTHKDTLEKLADQTGCGTVKRGKTSAGYKPIFRWQIGGIGCLELIEYILPYLVEKRPQATLLQLVWQSQLSRECAAAELRRLKKARS